MELILILSYVLCIYLTRDSAALYALFVFCISGFIVGYQYDSLLFAIMYAPICYAKGKYVKLSGLYVVILQYAMAWDYYANPTTETILFMCYPYVSFALELVLILSIIKGAKNGVYIANFNRCDGFKSNTSRC